MVKHTLAWALVAMTSLGAVYGMSNAATQAETTIASTSEIPVVTPPQVPAKPERTESGLDHFRFRNGDLEWQIQHIYSKSDIEKEKFNIRCYGRTEFYSKEHKNIVEEVNDYFSGKLAMTEEDEDGYSHGSVHTLLRPEEMRYTLKCGWFEKMILVNPRDWPSNVYSKEFATLNARSSQLDSRTGNSRASKKSYSNLTQIGKPETQEIVSAAVAGGIKTTKLKPGATNALVASFVIDVKKKMRINAITLTSPKWFKRPGVLKYVKITIDGKTPDSVDSSSTKGTLHWAGLGGYGLFDSVMPGKHLVEVKASITNAPAKKVFTDSFTLSGMQGIAGTGLKLKLKTPVRLQTYVVPYDKNRTKQQDDNLKQ